MSVFCNIMLSIGLNLQGCLPPEDLAPAPYDHDRSALETFIPPEPEPVEVPRPDPQPVIIVKESPPPPPPPVPEPVIAPPPPPEPDPIPEPSRAAQAAWAAIATGSSLAQRPLLTAYTVSGLSENATLASLPSGGVPGPSLGSLDDDATAFPDRYQSPGVDGGERMENNRIVRKDRYIVAVLETSVNTQLQSHVRLNVAYDVYSFVDDTLIIPKGSRITCEVGTLQVGETRPEFMCDTIFLAGTHAEIHEIDGELADMQGRGGVTGQLYTRFRERYGTVLTLAGISAAVRLATAVASDSTEDSTNSLGTTLSEGSAELSQQFGEISASILEETLNLEPIVTIPQGTIVTLLTNNNLYLKESAL